LFFKYKKEKARELLPNYPIQRYRQTPTIQIIKQQPALYAVMVPVCDRERYSRAQASVVYYSRIVENWRFSGLGIIS